MRVLWVFERLSEQLELVAANLRDRPDVQLEIMCRIGEPPPGVPMTRVKCRRKIDLPAIRAIRQQLATGEFDVVHAYTSRNLASTLAACRGLSHAPRVVGYRGTINRLGLFDPANWLTFWRRRLDHTTCVCHATRDAMLASGVAPDRLSVVWEACDPDSLTDNDPSISRAAYDLPEDAFVVGAVCNMRRVKGIHVLLEAALQLTHLPNFYCLLVGEVRDSKVARLARDARISDRLRMPGPIAFGGRLNELFDVYASPSLMEGLSMSIMEAMARRVCTVASDVGGNTELIRDQVDGLITPVGDAAALARALERLYGDPLLRERLAHSSHQRLLKEFSIAGWSDRLCGVYRKVASTAVRHAA